MNRKFLSIGTSLLLFFFIFAHPALSVEKASGSSAILAKAQEVTSVDARARILRKYLLQYNSPLADNAETFVKEADKNNIDWRLVAAISGVESTFGQQLPNGSYNAWGWGIYGTNMIYFKSYDDGIATISKGLKERYIDGWGDSDVYRIGRHYAASPTWASRVDYFMTKMQDFADQNQVETLSITL